MKFNSAAPTSDVHVSMPQPNSFATRAGTYNVSNTYRVPPPSSSDGKTANNIQDRTNLALVNFFK